MAHQNLVRLGGVGSFPALTVGGGEVRHVGPVVWVPDEVEYGLELVVCGVTFPVVKTFNFNLAPDMLLQEEAEFFRLLFGSERAYDCGLARERVYCYISPVVLPDVRDEFPDGLPCEVQEHGEICCVSQFHKNYRNETQPSLVGERNCASYDVVVVVDSGQFLVTDRVG